MTIKLDYINKSSKSFVLRAAQPAECAPWGSNDNPGQVNEVGAVLVVAPEHANVFYEGGWSKQRVKEELLARLWIPLKDIVPGRSGRGPMTPQELADPERLFPKFRTGTLNIVRAGGSAGKYTAIISSIRPLEAASTVPGAAMNLRRS